jgi:hypothetical protein
LVLEKEMKITIGIKSRGEIRSKNDMLLGLLQMCLPWIASQNGKKHLVDWRNGGIADI